VSKICHAHCPDDSGALLAAVLAVILTAVLAVIAAQVIESLFVAIVITGGVLIVAGTGLFVWLVQRDRIRPPARPPVLTGRVVRAIPAPAGPSRRRGPARSGRAKPTAVRHGWPQLPEGWRVASRPRASAFAAE
jgi:hypothetical protein